MENPLEQTGDFMKRVFFPASVAPPTPSHASGTANGVPRTPSSKAPPPNNASLAVFLRVRPPGSAGADVDKRSGRRTYQILEDEGTLRTFPPLSAAHSRTIKRQAKDFAFTRVFGPTAGQGDVYNATMRPLVDDVFDSQNGLLFAYGMTNAGKTFTVLGEEERPGLIPQALTDTFERVKCLEGKKRPRVEISFLEIYNENVYDLLAATEEGDSAPVRNALKLDDRMGVIQPRDLSKHCITTTCGGLELVRRATANRRVASTKLNEDSSRSHSVCMIKLVREDGKDSNLWVVDLAGSERSGRTGAGATSTRQKEANNINKGLSTLWHCLHIMRSNMRKDEPETRVPFRESKLTHLFKNHLQGAAAGRTVMVVNINPSTDDYDETQTVLKNSTVAREVRVVRDDSAAARQNGLINTAYGFDGRKTQLKKPVGSRRSIHQPVAPKLDALEGSLPRKVAQANAGMSHDSDCGSAGEEEVNDGYLSGAESDSGLVDTRQSMNLVVKNLQNDNEALRNKLKSALSKQQKAVGAANSSYQPTPGGPMEGYIDALENKVTSLMRKMREMEEDHQDEIRWMEEELEGFLDENGLNKDGTCGAAVEVSRDGGGGGSSAALERLQEEVRVNKLQAEQWRKEAETLRVRMEGMESRLSPAVNASSARSATPVRTPLRPSLGSASQGRASIEDRPGQDTQGENTPPGAVKVNVGPPPGGVGSPSKNAARLATPTKTKPSALPSKSSKKLSRSLSKSPSKSPSKKTVSLSPGVPAAAVVPKKNVPGIVPETVSESGSAPGPTPTVSPATNREQAHQQQEQQQLQSMVPPSPPQFPPLLSGSPVAESRAEEPVAHSLMSTPVAAVHGVEESWASGLRVSDGMTSVNGTSVASPAAPSSTGAASLGSPGFYSPGESTTPGSGKGKMVIAMSRRVSVLRGSTSGNGRRASTMRSSTAGARRMSRASVAGRRVSHARIRTSVAAPTEEAPREHVPRFLDDMPGGPSSRRESSMMAALSNEENFFEKTRRVLLRAMGVGARAGLLGGMGGADATPLVPATAAEIEAKQKIKVKMPKRPGKKGMEGNSGPLWAGDDEGDEEIVPPAETPAPNPVLNGIERWVFGAKDERRTPERNAGETSPSVSPVPTGDRPGRSMHEYLRAM